MEQKTGVLIEYPNTKFPLIRYKILVLSLWLPVAITSDKNVMFQWRLYVCLPNNSKGYMKC